jgi:translocation and assembly module TamB
VVLFAVLVIVGVFALLHSANFHAYVLRTAREKATARLGVPVRLQDFTVRWSGISPTLNLYNVVIDGAGAHANPPVLEVDHIEARVRVTSLLHHTWYINDMFVDHPVVHFYVDKNGENNLPKPRSSSNRNKTNVFDLGIRHARLANGEVYYNDQKRSLDADLCDLAFRSAFDTTQQNYSGSLGYRDGHLKYGAYRPLTHDFHADFVATREQFSLHHAVLAVGASRVRLDAVLAGYTKPALDATYQATVDVSQLRALWRDTSLPEGVIRANGTVHYDSEPNRSLLDTVIVNGELSSPSLAFRTSSFHGAIRDLNARYALANGSASVHDVHATVLGGQMTGTLTIADLTGATRSHLQAALHGVSLAGLHNMLSKPIMQQVNLTGTIDATADARWGKNLQDLLANTDTTVQAQMASAKEPSAGISVNGIIHARYSAPARQITLSQSVVRTPNTSLNLNGTVGNRSALQVQMRANNLQELETVADMFRTSTPGRPFQPLGLSGAALFKGSVSGAASAPHIMGQFAANNLRLKGSSFRLVRANIDASPSQVRLINGLLQPADRGQLKFALTAGLEKWKFTTQSPIEVNANGGQLNIADLTRAAGIQTPISGTLAANIAVHGSQLNPIGHGSISLTQAKVSNETIQSFTVNFHGTGEQVNADLGLRMPAGTAKGSVVLFPKEKTYEMHLLADGIRLNQLGVVKQQSVPISGVLNLDATGSGTLDNPGLQLTAKIPELRVRGQTIGGSTLQTNVANHIAKITFDSEFIKTAIHGQGTINLTGDFYADATLDAKSILFGPLVDAYAPSQSGNVTGQAELHASLNGPLKNRADLNAHIIIPSLTIHYKNLIQLSAVAPIRADFGDGVLQLQHSEIRGTGTDLQFQGTVPVRTGAPASLLLLGNVDLRLAQLYDSSIASSGQLRFNINSYGQTSNPNVQGQIDVINANFANGTLPLGLENGNGVLTLTNDRIDIKRFEGQVGSGTVQASGGIVYRPSLQFDLALKGNGIRTLLPQGIRAGIETQLTLTGNLQQALLSGRVRVDQLSFTPDFDLMNITGRLGGATIAPPSHGFQQALKLDVSVQSTNNINLISRTMSVQGSANLNVRGTAAEPVILGRINLTGGDLIFAGNRYVLQGGTVEFVNPMRAEPVVNLDARTTIDQYNINMRFWGHVDQLHTIVSSDPALPPSDIISLIAFGRTTGTNTPNVTPFGSLGAESLIASQVSSQLTSRVSKIAGISQLSIDPVLGGGGQSPGARIAIKQRVTSKIFVTFATDVSSTQREAITLQYQATPRISYSGTRDQNGGFSFDTQIRKTW